MENLITKAKAQDQEALIEILEYFKAFIIKFASRYNIQYMDYYDYLQLSYVTILKCIEKYKPGSKTFFRYTYNAIRNNINYMARSNKNNNKNLSLNNEISDNGNEEFQEILISETDIEEDFIRIIEKEKLNKIMSMLPEEDFELIFLVYFNGLSLKTYADRKGLSYIVAIKKKNRILKKLKCDFENLNY